MKYISMSLKEIQENGKFSKENDYPSSKGQNLTKRSDFLSLVNSIKCPFKTISRELWGILEKVSVLPSYKAWDSIRS